MKKQAERLHSEEFVQERDERQEGAAGGKQLELSRRERRDKGTKLITPRDLVVLLWIAQQYVARLDHVQELLSRMPGRGGKQVSPARGVHAGVSTVLPLQPISRHHHHHAQITAGEHDGHGAARENRTSHHHQPGTNHSDHWQRPPGREKCRRNDYLLQRAVSSGLHRCWNRAHWSRWRFSGHRPGGHHTCRQPPQAMDRPVCQHMPSHREREATSQRTTSITPVVPPPCW
jgi:hypothetical protein